jgi:hypothetical protein
MLQEKDRHNRGIHTKDDSYVQGTRWTQARAIPQELAQNSPSELGLLE